MAPDSGFDSGETPSLVRGRKSPHAVPLRREGNADDRRNAVCLLGVGAVTTVGRKADGTDRPVGTNAAAMRRPEEQEEEVYRFGDWDAGRTRSEARRAGPARQWYLERFGIETGHRQMNEVEAMTAKGDVAYRPLVIGLALLSRQVWAWLTRQLARDGGPRPTQWVRGLPPARRAEWLADLLEGKYGGEGDPSGIDPPSPDCRLTLKLLGSDGILHPPSLTPRLAAGRGDTLHGRPPFCPEGNLAPRRDLDSSRFAISPLPGPPIPVNSSFPSEGPDGSPRCMEAAPHDGNDPPLR